ncbi:MAG: hypothetical protein JWN04_2194, partial [Myxococcaceae bacterium]|nr:hypothetical protein [Myxococcaceae bacterium]
MALYVLAGHGLQVRSLVMVAGVAMYVPAGQFISALQTVSLLEVAAAVWYCEAVHGVTALQLGELA